MRTNDIFTTTYSPGSDPLRSPRLSILQNGSGGLYGCIRIKGLFIFAGIAVNTVSGLLLKVLQESLNMN